MEVNYERLILGNDAPLTDKVTLHIPTMRELIQDDEKESEMNLFTRAFVTSVREQFSGFPESVDDIEAKYPTMWDLAWDETMNVQVGEAMFGKDMTLLSVIVNGFAWWTQSEITDYKPLSNQKVVNEPLEWVIDKEEFVKFSEYIKMITLHEPNEDLIAPPDLKGKPHKQRAWKQLYLGRIRKMKKGSSSTIADKMLLMQALAPSFIPFNELADMTYYQFMNLLRAYQQRKAYDQEFDIYTSEKFDTSNMKLTDLSQTVGVVRLNN